MKTLRLSLGLLASFSALSALAQSAPTLKVGDPAPAFAVDHWVKGKPFKIEKGKTYVVEFWATWCGPCKRSIPHLTEMAKKYKDINFVGLSFFEHSPDYLSKVQAFVKDMGPKMDYNVGTGPDNSPMSKNWMDAAGQDGIPTMFIVDKTSHIVYIGNPLSTAETVFDDVLAGKLNAKTAKAGGDKEAAAKAEMAARAAQAEKDSLPFRKAMEAKDAHAVETTFNELIKKYPGAEAGLMSQAFPEILAMDEEVAYRMAKHATSGNGKDDPILANQIAWAIVEKEGAWKHPDYQYALDLASQASAQSQENDYNILDTLGLAHWRLGHKKDALFVQEKAVKLAKADPAADPSSVKELSARLEMYQKNQ